jgi:hypothetical protein
MIARDQKKKITLDSGVLAWADTETGLMWEVKNDGNLKFMYVWSKSRIANVAESNMVWMEDDVKDCESYIVRMNAKNYAGCDDWRFPTIDQLLIILYRNEGLVDVKPPLSKNCMRGTWSDTPILAVYVYKTGDWRNGAYIPTVHVLDLSTMSAAPYSPAYTLWIRAVRTL